jgi:KAP family P-loop domain
VSFCRTSNRGEVLKLTEIDVTRSLRDSAIRHADYDRLGRTPFAEELAKEILANELSSGFVVGLVGPWGSGKTSLLNLTTAAMGQSVTVIDFNPWMFSGTEDLIVSFFNELARQLGGEGRKAKNLARNIATYGQLFAPVATFVGVGGAVQVGVNVANRISSSPSLIQQRNKIQKELEALDKPLLVVIDDVDRLRPDEVRNIVRLVRLVGDFPNVIYLLAYDRTRVEECLDEDVVGRGRAYLQKIVQLSFDVPVRHEPDLLSLFVEGLNFALDEIDVGPFNDVDYQNCFQDIIRPLLKTPRDVTRLIRGIPLALKVLGDEVALADLLALEAVRILMPNMFDAVIATADVLGGSAEMLTGPQFASAESRRSLLNRMIEVDEDLTWRLCKRLFMIADKLRPDGENYGVDFLPRWRLEGKVASPEVLRIYLEMRLPHGVSTASSVKRLVESISTFEATEASLSAIGDSQLADALVRLDEAIRALNPAPLGALTLPEGCDGLAAVASVTNRLPKSDSNQNYSNPFIAIARISWSLLQRIPEGSNRDDTVRRLFDSTRCLSGKIILARSLGYVQDVGTRLISETLADELSNELLAQVRRLSPSELINESHVDLVVNFLGDSEAGREIAAAATSSADFLLAVLKSFSGFTTTTTFGSAAVQRVPTLPWDYLASIVGSEILKIGTEALVRSMGDRPDSYSHDEVEVVLLASMMADGYRRGIFGARGIASVAPPDPERPDDPLAGSSS